MAILLHLIVFALCAFSANGQGLWTPVGCRLDLCFILDTSGSITAPNWDITTEFAANFTSLMDISEEASQVGVISFSSVTYFDIALNKHAEKTGLMADILAIPYRSGGTAIHLGLEAARTQCFQSSNGDRLTAPNIAVLMTDGQSDYNLAVAEADRLRATGATIVAIGVGSGINMALLEAVAGSEENVFTVNDFDSLYEDINEILGKSCEASQHCAGGQLGNWTGAYPKMADCPTLYNPTVSHSTFVEFRCGLNYTMTDPLLAEARFNVTFLFDEKEDPHVPSQIVAYPTDEVVLHERHLLGKFGSYISCRVQTYYTSTTTVISPYVVSRSYWAGISFSHEFVDVYEDEDEPRTMFLFSTVPAVCLTDPSNNPGSDCETILNIVSEQSLAVFQNQEGLIRKCTYIFYPDDWFEDESIASGAPLQIAAQRDPFYGGVRRSTLVFRLKNMGLKHDPRLPEGEQFYENPWNGYSPGNVTVTIHDGKPATCRSTGDPMITTFDQRTYSAQQVGCFAYVRSLSSLPFAVDIQHYHCNPNQVTGCSIACGVAVKEGASCNIITRCNPTDTIHVLDCTGYSRNRVTTDAANKEYMITTPGGRRVKVTVLGRGFNVYITVPGRDAGKTLGLCGTYDEDPSNDFTAKNGQLVDVNTFIESWREPFPCMLGCNDTSRLTTSTAQPTTSTITTKMSTTATQTTTTQSPTTTTSASPTTTTTLPTTAGPTTTTTRPTTAGPTSTTRLPTSSSTTTTTTFPTTTSTTTTTTVPTTTTTIPTTTTTTATTTIPTTTSTITTMRTVPTTTMQQGTTEIDCPNGWKCDCPDPCADNRCLGYCSCGNNACLNYCRNQKYVRCECIENPFQDMCCPDNPPKDHPSCSGLRIMDQNQFCHCGLGADRSDELVNATQCGLPALEDPLGDMAHPEILMKAFIPGFLKQNAGPEDVDFQQQLLDTRTDDIDDEYTLYYFEETYVGGENPPAWGTFNVTEQQATDHCNNFLLGTQAHTTCSTTVTQAGYDNLVSKCVTDIQRTGELDWALNKLYEYHDVCLQSIYDTTYIQDRSDPLADPVFGPLMTSFLDASCPDDCSGNGHCQNGTCHCNQGFVGGDCSIVEGSPPANVRYLGSDVCDVQDRLCQSVKLQATTLVNSDKLACRVTVNQLDGISSVYDSVGQLHTGETIQCPLPDLLTLEPGNQYERPLAAYDYAVELSNDGVQFEPATTTSGRMVVDSSCMECSNHSSCVQKVNTCLIEGRCHTSGEKKDTCLGCYPDMSVSSWNVDPDLPTPLMTSNDVLIKVETEELVMDLDAIDPLGKLVVFLSKNASDTSTLLLPNGTFVWRQTPDVPPPDNLGVQLVAVDDCPRNADTTLNLITMACQDICGVGGQCSPDPAQPRGQGYYVCQCAAGLSGPNCEQNLDECVSSPCQHGSCNDLVNGYTCSCTPEYGGVHCDSLVGTVSDWGAFGPCSKQCDYGLSTRSRQCLTPPCTAELEDNVLCSEFNCPDNPEDLNEGSVLRFVDSEMLMVVEEESLVWNTTALALNLHCTDEPEDCCSAVGKKFSKDNPSNSLFNPDHITNALGFPREDNSDILLKVLAELTDGEAEQFCSSVQRRRRSAIQQSIKVDKEFMDEAISQYAYLFSQNMNANVEVDGVETSSDSSSSWVIVGATFIGVMFVVIIVLAALLATKNKHNKLDDDKTHMLASNSSLGSIRMPSVVPVTKLPDQGPQERPRSVNSLQMAERSSLSSAGARGNKVHDASDV